MRDVWKAGQSIMESCIGGNRSGEWLPLSLSLHFQFPDDTTLHVPCPQSILTPPTVCSQELRELGIDSATIHWGQLIAIDDGQLQSYRVRSGIPLCEIVSSEYTCLKLFALYQELIFFFLPFCAMLCFIAKHLYLLIPLIHLQLLGLYAKEMKKNTIFFSFWFIKEFAH